jgi:hypothetical protein
MRRLNAYRMRLVLVGFMAAIALGGGSARADFTFGEPTNLGPIVNSSYWDGGPYISDDGLEMYFDSNEPGGQNNFDLWVTRRATTEDEWGAPERLGPSVNSSALDGTPCISADGLTLYFHSERPGGFGHYDLWVTTRQTKNDSWGEPVNLGPKVNSSTYEFSPNITADGLSLYFESPRPGGYGIYDIWMTTRPTKEDDWGAPINLGPPINGPARDQGPCISPDRLILFLTSNRPGGYGSWDLWMTRRTTTSDAWGEPVNLGPKVNTSYLDGWPCLSPDGSTLYISSQRPGGHGSDDIWQSPIIPIVDFNGDEIVDASDMCIMIDHWGENCSLCDIGPMPWGDGIVDVEDLKVLAEYFFGDLRCVAHFKLDEAKGSIANDSARNRDGTVYGSPQWQPIGGVLGGALQLDGVDDYVRIGSVLSPADGALSVFAWIRGGAPGQAVLSQTGASNWLCTDAVEGYLMTELKTTGRGSSPLLSRASITDGDWHRVGFVWDGSYRYLYVDGAEVAKDASPLSDLESASGGLYFGVGSALAPGTFFSGLIDDIRIYNRAIKP